MLDELHGPLRRAADSVQNLAEFARIRLLADTIGLESLDREGTAVVLRFRQDRDVDPAVLASLLQTRAT